MDKKELLEKLAPDIAEVDAVMREDIAGLASPVLRKVLEYALFNGGKRIRPILTVLAMRLCREEHGSAKQLEDERSAFCLAISFEYLHAASLLHDDVIDKSEVRRGRPAANLVWGAAAVILAGDFLHARAMQLAAEIGGPPSLLSLSRATTSMIEGEFLQAAKAQDHKINQQEYFRILAGKTGALIGAACETGAILAGAGKEQIIALQSFGEHLGLAFQVVDDLLDYLGDPLETGKDVGNDFIEGKITLPLIYALEAAGQSERDQLLHLLQSTPEERRSAMPMVHDVISTLGGFRAARQKAEHLIDAAIGRLINFRECPSQSVLTSLAAYVLARKK